MLPSGHPQEKKMAKRLLFIFSILLLGCSTKKEIPAKRNTYFIKVKKAFEQGDCSSILKGEADNYFYQPQYKTDTTDLFILFSKYNEAFTDATGKKTIGTCRNNEICEKCKDLLFSILMINNSLEYTAQSPKVRIEKWFNDANTFTSRSDIAYGLRKHYFRTSSIKEIKQMYYKLNSSHRSFLFGKVESEIDLDEIIYGIKDRLIASPQYYH